MSAGPQRERKVITVLFCDLVGFTARAESLDPEDVEAVLRPYHERVRGELERHGGTVEKFAGDAVLALFGAPRAHEDDPERAVRAALAIRDWAREGGSLQVRIGMTTGEALVTVGARPEAGEAMASGDVVNTAARLQTAAPENGILVDEATYRATERQVLYEEAPPVAAKGKANPVWVYEAMSARSRFGVDVDEAPRTPLVGRERELELVIGALARARDSRSPQLVTVVGVPGIGKSRLVLELLRVVDTDEELITWRQGRCLPYGDGVAFWAVGEMVKAQADILDTDSAEDATTKLERVMADVVGADADWVLAHVKPLIGLAEQQQVDESRVEAFAAWRRFFEALAELRPLVLVFEDLHWADDGLLDFVDHLVEWASGVSILVVATTRPELLERRPAWGGGKLNAATLGLSPLSDTEAARLVAELLGSAVLPAETQTALLVRAGGNPLYAEQYARLFLERGSERDLPLPETVQGIIAARLDSLPPEEKAALQHAAVVGKVFWPAAITALGSDGSLPELLHSLERKEFVRRERRSTVAGETEFAFRHALVRDVAYSQIPRLRRAESHRLTAEWIDALSERSDDFAELLAHHYSSALELMQAGGGDIGDLAERARLSLRQAGNRALALGAFPVAARFYSRALGLWPPDDPELPALQLAFAEVARWLDEYPIDLIVEARDGLLAQGDLAGAAKAEAMLGFAFRTSGRYDLGWMHWDAGIALLARAEPSRATAQGYAQMAVPALLAGDDEEAIRRARKALEIAAPLGLEDVRAHALLTIGPCQFSRGEDGWLATLEEGLAVSEQQNAVPEMIRGYKNLGDALLRDGQLGRAFHVQGRGLETALRFGDRFNVRWFQVERAIECYITGKWVEAIELAGEFIGDVEAGAPHFLEPACRQVRTLIRLARGDDPGALADCERLLSTDDADPQSRLAALGGAVRTLVEVNRGEQARPLLDEAVKYLKQEGPGVPDIAVAAADLGALVASDVAGTRRWTDAARLMVSGDFVAAADIYATIGSLPDEADARLRAARALVEAGRRPEADAQLQRALAFYRSVGATRYLRQGEALLAASA